jgi:hypothetical protein
MVWKEVVVTYFKVLCQHFSGGDEEVSLVKVTGHRAEVLNQFLLRTKQKSTAPWLLGRSSYVASNEMIISDHEI